MDEFEPAFLTELVGRIYEAAVDSAQWGDFLALLERFHPDTRITLFAHEDGRPADALTVHRNYLPDDLRAYLDHYVKNSPHVARVHKMPVGRAVLSETAIEDREFHTTEHYNEFVRPRRLGYHAAGIVLERAPGRMTALSLANLKNDPDQRARQIRLLDLLAPHLVRAIRLHRTLALKTAGGEAAQAALDRWAHAAFVLNASGRVVWHNGAAEALLRRADGLSLGREGQLLSADDVRTRALEVAARKCASMSEADKAEINAADLNGIALPRPSGGAPLRAMIWPLPFLGGGAAPLARGTALLMILDPERTLRTPVGWLARQYGLSPAEQRLTEAIVNGVPLAEAAEQFGIRLSTARQRLKDIQAKTHCPRQSDLIRLAFSLPEVRND
jgi:DNA-binding CsgD family transcriptional regulator/PAS domain-containing protein